MVEDGLSACIKRSVYAVHCGLKSVERGFRAFHHSSERILSLTSLITKSMQFIQHHQDLKPLTAAVSLGYGKQHKNWEKGVKSVKLTHTKKEKSKEKTFTCRSMFVEDDLEGCRGLESKCCIDLSIDLHHSSSSDFSILHQYSWFMKTHRCRRICQNFINGCVKFLWLLPELSWWAHLWKAQNYWSDKCVEWRWQHNAGVFFVCEGDWWRTPLHEYPLCPSCHQDCLFALPAHQWPVDTTLKVNQLISQTTLRFVENIFSSEKHFLCILHRWRCSLCSCDWA